MQQRSGTKVKERTYSFETEEEEKLWEKVERRKLRRRKKEKNGEGTRGSTEERT